MKILLTIVARKTKAKSLLSPSTIKTWLKAFLISAIERIVLLSASTSYVESFDVLDKKLFQSSSWQTAKRWTLIFRSIFIPRSFKVYLARETTSGLRYLGNSAIMTSTCLDIKRWVNNCLLILFCVTWFRSSLKFLFYNVKSSIRLLTLQRHTSFCR